MRTPLSVVIAIIDAEWKHQLETSIHGELILHPIMIRQTMIFEAKR